MKTKKFDKKLTLNKKTISSLNNGQMKHVYGGEVSNVAYRKRYVAITPPFTCYSCPNCPDPSICHETCFEC